MRCGFSHQHKYGVENLVKAVFSHDDLCFFFLTTFKSCPMQNNNCVKSVYRPSFEIIFSGIAKKITLLLTTFSHFCSPTIKALFPRQSLATAVCGKKCQCLGQTIHAERRSDKICFCDVVICPKFSFFHENKLIKIGLLLSMSI